MSVSAPVLTSTNGARIRMSRGLVLLFAIACGVGVANLYYAQPILNTIAKSYGASSGTAGLIVTVTQIGYVVGLALLVPLGDLLARRRLVPALLAIAAAGLIASAAAPSIGVLIAVALIVGATSVVAQVLIPMAASLADDEHRGQIVGTVMSGLLLGILLARTVSGVVAGATSWRVVYVMAAVFSVALAIVLGRLLPPEESRPAVRYRALLHTTVTLVRSESLLRRRCLFGALAFAAFSVFWTTMAFLLSGAPFDYGDTTIGLFGLVGAAGAICANFAGRWADQGLTRGTTLVFAACIAISFLPLWYGRHDLAMLIIGILILDIGAQGLMVTNQSLIYRLTPEFRSRITSAYMVSYFVGGAIGSALGSTLYDTYGWAGVATLGAVLGIIATLAAVVDTIRRPTLPADDSTRARRRLSKRDLRTLSNEGTVVPSLQEPTTILSNTPLTG